MESGQYADVSMHEPLMMPVNEKNQVKTHNDIMARRLKSRERQARYRARKRLQAELKKHPTSLLLQHHQADIQMAYSSVPLPQGTHVVSRRKKARNNSQSAPLAIEMAVNDIARVFASRVHCQRDWKKDARRAHLYKDQTAVGGNQLQPSSTGINANPTIVAGVQLSVPLPDNNETRSAMPGRRHWKAEARNKKN